MDKSLQLIDDSDGLVQERYNSMDMGSAICIGTWCMES